MSDTIQRLPALPLITHDPYFSVWDCGDTPTGANTCHWSGAKKRLLGQIAVDGQRRRFLGTGGAPAIPRTGVTVTPLSTRYTFEDLGVRLTVVFTSPLLPDEPDVLSAPITFVRFSVEFTDGKKHQVSVSLTAHESLVCSGEKSPKLRGDAFSDGALSYAYLGQAKQDPLSGSGDQLTIDWGYLFFAAREGSVDVSQSSGCALCYSLTKQEPFVCTLMIGYDDVASINYFGALLPAYYARRGRTLTDALREFSAREDELLARCAAFDQALLADARQLGGEDYALIVSASYRQAVAAHKLVEGRSGELLFISKENGSNGCAATADVSYPSVPLFLLFCPELVRGMLRPIFRFARMPVWTHDYAPHDAGRYPVLNGQIYGARHREKDFQPGDTVPPYYLYPSAADVYPDKFQMPVEECGNMLLMTCAVCRADGDYAIARDNLDLLQKWSRYLAEYGEDPGEQLCTDDFAGHLARNVNLAAKAFMGMAAYGEILETLGEDGAAAAWQKARDMAKRWYDRAGRGALSPLSFDGEGWSLKYNLVWDKLFAWELLPADFYEKELAGYLTHLREFGVPLDSRSTLGKTDWTAWVAAMAEDRATRDALLAPIAHYLRQRRSPVPFSDFYDTVDGVYAAFIARSVQGGMFMPLLREKWRGK